MLTREFTQFVQNRDGSLDESHSDFQFKHWAMASGHNVVYKNDQCHTLSFYLKGGEENKRLGEPTKLGKAGSFCFMPQEQDSIWEIKQNVEFAHIYFSQKLVQRYATNNFDMDARFIELKDQTFLNDQKLQELFLRCFKANQNLNTTSLVMREELCNELLSHIIEKFNVFSIDTATINGGLSPIHRKQIISQIVESLDEKLTIDSLAKSINLSPFHFAKMFKISFGESPASYINWMRVQKVKLLIKNKVGLAQISAETGFNNQSHMTHSFKQLTGITPGRYRSHISN